MKELIRKSDAIAAIKELANNSGDDGYGMYEAIPSVEKLQPVETLEDVLERLSTWQTVAFYHYGEGKEKYFTASTLDGDYQASGKTSLEAALALEAKLNEK